MQVITGIRNPTRCGSKTWSARSLMGRESSEDRKDLVKASSDMMAWEGPELGEANCER